MCSYDVTENMIWKAMLPSSIALWSIFDAIIVASWWWRAVSIGATTGLWASPWATNCNAVRPYYEDDDLIVKENIFNTFIVDKYWPQQTGHTPHKQFWPSYLVITFYVKTSSWAAWVAHQEVLLTKRREQVDFNVFCQLIYWNGELAKMLGHTVFIIAFIVI